MASVENSLNLAISFDKKQSSEQLEGSESEFSSLFSETLDNTAQVSQVKKHEPAVLVLAKNKEASNSNKQSSELATELTANDDAINASTPLLAEEQTKEKTIELAAEKAVEASDNPAVNALFSQLQHAATAVIDVKIFKENFGMDPNQGGQISTLEPENSEGLSTSVDKLAALNRSFTLTPLSQVASGHNAATSADEALLTVSSSSSLLAAWLGQSVEKTETAVSAQALATDEIKSEMLVSDFGDDAKSIESELDLSNNAKIAKNIDLDTLLKTPASAILTPESGKVASVNIEQKTNNELTVAAKQTMQSVEQRILQLMEQVHDDGITVATGEKLAVGLNAIKGDVELTFKPVTSSNESVGQTKDTAKLLSALSELLPQVAAELKSSNTELATPLAEIEAFEIEVAKLRVPASQLSEISAVMNKLGAQVDKLAGELGLDKKVLQDLLAKITDIVTTTSKNVTAEPLALNAPVLANELNIRELKKSANPVLPLVSNSLDQAGQTRQKIDTALGNQPDQLPLEPTESASISTLANAKSVDDSARLSQAYTSSLAKGEVALEMTPNAEQENQKLAKNLAINAEGEVTAKTKEDINDVDKLQHAAQKLVLALVERLTPEQNSVYQPALASHVNIENEANINSIGNINQLVTQRTQVNTPAPTEAVPSQVLNMFRSEAAKELHDRVSVMLSLNKHEADIRLDPPELGSMQIRVRSDAEQAQINFVVQNQQAKEALEQSLPRLKEMLAEQGINLGESSIEQQNQQSSEQQQGQQSQSRDEKAFGDEIVQSSITTARIASTRPGGVDFYA
ncbi:flagellar hook-length control protein FliK [Pseudoalteromonas tunicata]|uniref:flagellar hook-length control protein FliK n=1 Tax=Pseudoalteromonas tunicata TaxID=314281 RepID=UPI00273F1FA3|nr:flagellar hook-length control protein FliK [Pseudoalteromonas tunicata]MDP4982537.1 flagellar hook-length control protein FliK [Pseudoalteromonas tunicata]